MNAFLSRMSVAAATALAVAGCVPLARNADPAPATGGWKDAGTPAPSVEPEREVRYYRDEQGAIWDDRGRKQAAKP